MLKVTCALAMLFSATFAYANCGNCGSKAASAKACPTGACAETQCASAGCCEKSCSSACSTTCSSDEGCPIAAAMSRLPKLTYAVGEHKTNCPKEAAKLAKESNGHVHYCVASKEYDSQADAQAALVTATEKFVAAFAEPHACPNSGQLTLAGEVQSCKVTAAKKAKLMSEAMAKVKMSYAVGDKQCSCPLEAGRLAKESGSEKQFVVAGEKTCCEQTARLNLARAKYLAAVKAIAQTDSDSSSNDS